MQVKVLSLFDGISCGMVALERAGITVDRYVAYEIDKYAIQVSTANYLQIEHCGDVTTADFTKYKGFDLLIGGSPCTYWSIAKKDRETTSDGIGFQLFSQYVRALKESGCKWFFYENNYSIHKDIKAEISKALGVEPIMINSALVSAQQRKRMYWTNIPGIQQPNDKGILLKDILESGIYEETNASEKYMFKNLRMPNDKSVTLTASSYKGIGSDGMTTVIEPISKPQKILNVNPSGNGMNGNVYSIDGKSPYVTTNKGEGQKIIEPLIVKEATKKGYVEIEPGSCVDLTQPNSKTRRGREMKDKCNCIMTSCQYYQYLGKEPIRLGQIGKGGQGQRIYSISGKSVGLSANGGGQGAKTGLYKIDLPDGDYIIRKLTPIEAERLQTLPDNYTAGISNSQRYKCIGNGWTVDIVAHILSYLKAVTL